VTGGRKKFQQQKAEEACKAVVELEREGSERRLDKVSEIIVNHLSCG